MPPPPPPKRDLLPKVPEGWRPVWDPNQAEWYYENIHNPNESTWSKPTRPATTVPGAGGNNYNAVAGANEYPAEKHNIGSKNPYSRPQHSFGDDEAYARRLEAGARHGSADRGASDTYYQGGYN